MTFYDVAQIFSEIEQTSKRLEMTELLAQLLERATPDEAAIICNLSIGQLRAPHEGTQFNIAEKLLVGVVARMLGVTAESVKRKQKKMGDLGAVLVEGDWSVARHPALEDVYKKLCAIEKISGTGAQEKKSDAIVQLLERLEPISGQYAVRMIIQKLRLGFSDMTIIDALSWMEAGNKSLRGEIEDAYNVCADIGRIARVLKKQGMTGIRKIGPVVGIPIRPAAAERLPTAKDIVKKIGPCIAQPKLDGFRLQIHLSKKRGSKLLRFFSRNLQDMSAMFPDLVGALEKLSVKELICEGEAIGYNPATESFLPFQQTAKRRRKYDIEQVAQDIPLFVFLFDVLFLDGNNLMAKTHTARRRELKQIAGQLKGVVRIIDERKIETAKDLEEYFLQNITAGLEGLVVKKPEAHYQPGKRNFNWIKLKRQETGHLEDTVDCVILGYYAGAGKRARFGIGAFLVGLYNKKEDRFETIAKIGTGLSDIEWADLKKRCDELEVKSKPRDVMCNKQLYPDVWISPELVCAVRADEITLSPVHAAGKTAKDLGFALRFPRFMGYREDKSATDATSIAEIKRLYKDQVGR